MTRAVLSIGSNLGDRIGHLRTAVTALREVLLVASGVYETPPWGDTEQPPYLNAVLVVRDPGATPRDWLDRARAIEEAAGRVRDPLRRFGPRSLDVDVIAVWDEAGEAVLSDDPELTLPHPRAHLRAFVLRPWIDVEPYGRLPGHGWLTDLLNAQPVAGDVADLSPRPELPLESVQ
ncbi:2-amino-4-hydroxy-6-hydroxymethyldihydropteridine diphosphokinase [Micromonospora sp. NPDC049559]|uniref:2-amino-4-hydroxy-6- hydroxymethyldihydropteridine diphosphokinase n=1 Tax=Micromonospora sp. NPDC049559 TaxID=3155923 RepID=UPI0034240528